jgi:hypothetical protein
VADFAPAHRCTASDTVKDSSLITACNANDGTALFRMGPNIGLFALKEWPPRQELIGTGMLILAAGGNVRRAVRRPAEDRADERLEWPHGVMSAGLSLGKRSRRNMLVAVGHVRGAFFVHHPGRAQSRFAIDEGV